MKYVNFTAPVRTEESTTLQSKHSEITAFKNRHWTIYFSLFLGPVLSSLVSNSHDSNWDKKVTRRTTRGPACTRGSHRDYLNCNWRGALLFSLICAWITDWVNNREAGHLRRNHAHYDVIIIWNGPFGTTDPIDDISSLGQVMAWSSQTTSHYLNQCGPIYVSPYGITRPQ